MVLGSFSSIVIDEEGEEEDFSENSGEEPHPVKLNRIASESTDRTIFFNKFFFHIFFFLFRDYIYSISGKLIVVNRFSKKSFKNFGFSFLLSSFCIFIILYFFIFCQDLF